MQSAVAAGIRLEDVVIRSDALTPDRIDLLRAANVREISTVRPKGMARLTSVVHDQGVVATAAMKFSSVLELAQKRRILALNGVQDPGNVGTLIRTAAWFGVDAVLADSNTADFFNPKAVRATAGGIWDVALVRNDDLAGPLSMLKSKGFECFGADVSETERRAWRETGKSILVLGSEAHGLSSDVRAKLDGYVHVRGSLHSSSGVESLNVATAGSILISRWVQ